jgi:hypothetical protein
LKYKERIKYKLLNNVEKVLPDVRKHIVHVEVGTPLTSEHYINSTKANVYGTEKSFWQTGPFSFNPQTEVENLFLCGASILAHGVGGASNSGVQTAAKILNCNVQDLIKPIEGQQVRIYDAENSSEWPQWIHEKREAKRRRAKELDTIRQESIH